MEFKGYNMEKKYYEAYDDRYKQIHEQNLQWSSDRLSKIVVETIKAFSLSTKSKILEIGCGEGRDAYPLLAQGLDVLATDISPEAISYCKKKFSDFEQHFRVVDCVTEKLDKRFDFIYSIAVIHMLVTDNDRNAFYRFIREHLTSDGTALICTMGDGNFERQTDIHTAFDIIKRVHEETGKIVQIANTSCRIVSFATFEKELVRNDLEIINQGITSVEPDFPQMMFVVVKCKK